MQFNIQQPLHSRRTENLTVKQVRCFLAASKCRNFSRAAEEVFQTQSAFSRNIQELESVLGEELFTRSHSGVCLSEAGEVFLPHAERLAACYAETVSGLVLWRAGRSGRLLLAGGDTVMPLILPTLLDRLALEFGNAFLDFESGSSSQVIASVLAGRAALGVCVVIGDSPGLVCRPLLEVPLALLASPDCVLPKEIRSLDDLRDVPLVRLNDESVISRALRLHGAAFDAYFNSSVVGSSVPASLPLVKARRMAMVSSGVGAADPQAQGLCFVSLPGLLPSVRVSLISRQNAVFDPFQQILKDLVISSVRSVIWHPTICKL